MRKLKFKAHFVILKKSAKFEFPCFETKFGDKVGAEIQKPFSQNKVPIIFALLIIINDQNKGGKISIKNQVSYILIERQFNLKGNINFSPSENIKFNFVDVKLLYYYIFKSIQNQNRKSMHLVISQLIIPVYW